VSWFLSALGVYLRDINQITGVFVSILLFVSPVFYPLSAISGVFRDAVLLNPLTLIIEQARAVLIYKQMPNWDYLFIYFLLSIMVAWAGYFFFQKTRRGFADVL
jgi:lipopolysaccharide transport system permease protein